MSTLSSPRHTYKHRAHVGTAVPSPSKWHAPPCHPRVRLHTWAHARSCPVCPRHADLTLPFSGGGLCRWDSPQEPHPNFPPGPHLTEPGAEGPGSRCALRGPGGGGGFRLGTVPFPGRAGDPWLPPTPPATVCLLRTPRPPERQSTRVQWPKQVWSCPFHRSGN